MAAFVRRAVTLPRCGAQLARLGAGGSGARRGRRGPKGLRVASAPRARQFPELTAARAGRELRRAWVSATSRVAALTPDGGRVRRAPARP
jgi:hypothetical protein